MSHSARGNPTDLYQRLLDANGDTVEERFQISAGGRAIAEIVRTTSGDETLYLHTDRLGSAETISTSSGEIFDQRFDPFGAPEPGDPPITRAGFTGHAHDRDLGLIDMKGRVYDPLASRFTTADPIMQEPHWSQGMNRYAYVFNDPINATDPSGFISMSNIVGGFVAAGHFAAFVVPAIYNGSLPTLGAVGAPTVGSAVTVPGLLQGQPGSGPTVVPAEPDLRLAQNMGDPSTGTDIPGNVPDAVARPDVPPRLGPSDAIVVVLPRTLVAVAEAAGAWLARAGAALRALGPTLGAPEIALASPITIPGDSVQPPADAAARDIDIQPGKGHRAGGPLSEDEAVDVVRRGGDVIARNRATAERIAEKAGRGKPFFDEPHGPQQKPHFHPRGPNGERAPGHILY